MRNTSYRFLTLLCLLSLGISTLFAVPAYRGWQTITLSDGTEITARLNGDEFYHFWETEDGKIINEQPDGTFVITETDRPNAQQIKSLRMASALYKSQPRKAIGERNLAPKGLVILVQFANVSFNASNDATAFNNMLNQEGYNYNGATGSAVDYFKAQSNNTYTPSFDVFGPVTLPNDRVYYGEQGYSSKTNKTENDLYIADFVIDAVKAANDAGCDFSQYDSDNDGYVDIVYFFYAGKGQAAGGTSETIWPHNWDLNSALYYEQTHGTSGYAYSYYATNLPKYDGKYINNYVCSAELRKDGSRSGIGTLCHEFSHVIGMPDYYDTEYGENDDNGITPGQWSIMDQGSYNNNEMTPPNYSLYDKYYMGWITEPQLLAKDAKKNVTLTTGYSDGYQISGTTTRRAYNYYSDANPVYYIENRQKTGWDAYLPGSGMLVWKVMYNATKWEDNEPNNTTGSPRYTIVPADGKTKNYGAASDLFPTSSVNSYTPYTGCALTEITKSGSNITFKYNGGVTKTTATYEFLTEHCTAPADGSVALNAPLSITITPATGYSLADASCWTVEMGGVALTYGTDFTYTPSTNTFYIASLTDDVVIMAEAKQIRTVTWSVNGATTTSTFLDGAALVLPSTPADCSGSGGKKFVGWTASSSVSGSAPADLFTSAGTKTVTANTTYYAVYATAGSGGGSSTTTYTFTIDKDDFTNSGGYAANNGEHTSTAVDVDDNTNTLDITWTSNQVYQNDDMQWQKSKGYIYNNTDLGKINSVTVSKVSGSFTTYYGTSEQPTNTSLGTSDGYFKVVTGTSSAGHTNSITVNFTQTSGGGTSYSDYSTTCAAPTYTIRFFDGTTKLKEESLVAGATATPPSDPADCTDNGYTFVGWYTSKLADDNTTVTSGWITDFTVSTAQDYYAVYSHTETSGSGDEASLTKQGSSSSFSAGDNIVIVAKSTSYALYQETVSTSYVKNWSFENSATTVGADAKNYLTLSAGTTTGKWYLGDATNGYLYNTSSGNELYVKTDGKKNEWTITWNSTQSAFTIVGGRNLACRTDLTGSNANKYRSANGTSNGIAYFDIYKYVAGGGSSTTYYTGTKDCTLPTEVTITFHKNDGTDATTSQTITYNTATALTVNTFSRTGYTFQGWATSATGTKAYDDEESVTLTKNTDLYAVWQKNSHNVSYSITPVDKATATINSSATTPQSIDYGETVTLDITPDAEYNISSVTATGGVTLSGTGTQRTFTMPDNDVAISITLAAKPKYTVTWSANGSTTTEEYLEGASINFPATATGCDGKVFRGWSTDPVAETDDEPTYVTPATMPNHDVTYYAVYATEGEGTGTATWEEAEITTLTSSDVFVIVGNGAYALPNNASGTPSVSSVTVSEGKITSTVGNTLTWNISGNGTDGYTFYPNGSTTKWLFSNTKAESSSNTNIRVGTGEGSTVVRKVWKLDTNNQLVTKDTYTPRYLAVQGNSDWRGYVSATTSTTTITFYKQSSGVSYSGYTTACGASISAKNVGWITATKGQKVKRVITVSAKNFDDPTTLSATCANSHFNVSLAATAVPDGAEGLTTTLTVEYIPTDFGTKDENVDIVLTAGDKTRTIKVNGRSLPEEFIIIAKQYSKWYAVPANMNSGSNPYDGVEVTPNTEPPTFVSIAPSTIIYSLRTVASERYNDAGNCVLLVGNDDRCLWANGSTNGTGIYNNNIVSKATDGHYEWLLATEDGAQYTISNPAHPDAAVGRRLANGGSGGTQFGLYKEATTFYIVPIGCSSQPQDVHVSAKRVDATFSWISNASSVTIDVYTNESMTEGHLSATATSSPYIFSGLKETTEYWYKLTPGTSTDCAVEGTFRTSGPVVDITEWKEDGVVLFIDKGDINPVIVIDGQEEHGSITGGGGSATELFFSKYFEGSGDMKLVAIFNGTGHDIDLSDYKLYTKNCSAPKTEAVIETSVYSGTTEYPISALGTIKAGHEIVFFTRPSTTGTQANLSACSVDYLNEVATHKEVTDNPRWIECDNSTYYGGETFPLMQFNGNDAICLEKNDNLIDVIGATGDPGKVKNCANRLNDLGWSIRVKNIDYGKSVTDEAFDYLYEASSKTPSNDTERKAILEGFGINLDDEYIDLTTARCILFRDKRVVSGDSAVTMNSGAQFVTCTSHTEGGTPYLPEWNGRAVCMDDDHQAAAGVTDDSKATCNSYQDLGAFNFTDYYIDYTSHIEPGQTLDHYTHDDETHLYTIPIDNLSNYTCLNIRFQLKKDGEVLTEEAQQVPIIVSGSKTTKDDLFSKLVIDQETHLPSYSHSVERCKTCNVVVLADATLTKAADDDGSDVPQVSNVKVYPTGKLYVPSGTNYTVNSLSLRRQEDDVASAKIEGTLNVLTDDATYLDIRIDPTNWHYFTLPYDCNVSDIRFANEEETAIPVVGTDFLLCSYDGEHRAATKSTSWKDLTSTDVLKKGIGYIIAIPGDGKVQREFRFPMANTVLTEENDDKLIGDLHAWGGNDAELRPNHKGWNLIGNPYMMYYNLPTTTTPLAAGTLIHDPDEDPWLGHWVIKDGTGDDAATPLYYIVVPQDNGWSEYKQTTIGGFDMPPFTSYFVQLGGNPDENKGINFVTTNKEDGPSPVIRRAPAEDIVDNHEVWFGVDLINTDGESDETTLLMSDKFTNDYDMMRDLVKMRGTYYTYYTKPVLASRNNEGEMAFNALPDSTAAAGVPLSFFAAADGQYRFTVSAHYPLDEVKEAYIYDNDNADAKWHNLLQEDYVFNTKRGDNTSRFLLAVKVERKQPEITTSIDNLHKGLVLTTINRTLMLSGLTNDADIYVYDVSGKLLDARLHYSSESGIFRTTVNTAGLYFVRVKTPDGQQTLETVVY